jgi:tight adherence protein B
VVTLIVAVLGVGVAAGILGLTCVLLRRPFRHRGEHLGSGQLFAAFQDQNDGEMLRRIRKLAVPTTFGLLCILITRWPVAGAFGGFAAATLPSSLRKVLPGEASKRTEAVATWTELIRDALAASAGLAQAIVVTAPSAPLPIRPEVRALATRLSNGVPLESALRSFAIEVDDPAAEFLVCALLLAATSRAQRLVEVLSALADSIREDVSMHLRVDASRASARSSVRTVMLFSMGFAFTLAVVAHSYLTPFGTAVGQLVLGVVGLFYATGLVLMVRLVRPTPEMRLLDSERVG